MKSTSARNLLSLTAVVVFYLAAVGSSQINKIHCGAFNTGNKVEDASVKGDFLVKDDGTLISGDAIRWKSGLLSKNEISIDNNKFKINEIRGYRYNGIYYGRIRSSYIKRIVHGKINVYQDQYWSTETNSSGRMRQVLHCQHYVQQGENGEIVPLANQKDILKFVKDCPEAAAMINVSSKKIRKSIRHDRNFLNSIFDIYNNDCKKKD